MRILPILSFLLLVAAAPLPASAQTAEGRDAAVVEQEDAAPSGAAAAQAPAPARPFTSTPLGATQPRTLRSFWHLFVAFTVAWALVFGYALWIGRRFSRLETELRQLRREAAGS